MARSNLMAIRSRAAGWMERRRGAKYPTADLEVIGEIKAVITEQLSYGYIRVWGMVT